MDSQANIYLRYYRAQAGGNLPAFHGVRRGGKYGTGLGDILRNIWRTIFPIAARGASTFLNETLKARDSGAATSGWAAAAKAAIAPTAQTVLSQAIDKVREATAPKPENNAEQQKGSGKRRKRRASHRKLPALPMPQFGNGWGTKQHYAGYKRMQIGDGKRQKKKSKKIKFLNF